MIPNMIVQTNSIDNLKEKLTNYQALYNTLIKLNKEVINEVTPNITRVITKKIREEQTEQERLEFLFDFLTTYLSYSEEYYQNCLQTPPIDGFNFDFKNNIPVDTSIEGLLVIGQGLCDDISNLMIYLGNLLQLKIKKIICEYNGELHSINMITFTDGTNSLIDATRKIRGNKTKEECFLVSKELLNKDNNYSFQEPLTNTVTVPKQNLNFSEKINKLITEINELKPQIEDLNNKKRR